MLARPYRLTRKDNVPWILSRGRLINNSHWGIRFTKNTLPHSRFTVIVSKKIYAKATQRNHLRRQIYEIIRKNQGTVDRFGHFDMVLLPKKVIIESSFQEMETRFISLIHSLQ